MKVIFLDIDGVLNSEAYFATADLDTLPIDTACLPLLRSLIEQSGATIVLSSSWKRGWTDDCALARLFHAEGIIVGDVTPTLGTKQAEITAWLADHSNTDRFAILDDATDGWGALFPHLVNTNPTHGLREQDVTLALSLLT